MQVSKEIGVTVGNKWESEQFLSLKSQSRKDTFSKENKVWVRW